MTRADPPPVGPGPLDAFQWSDNQDKLGGMNQTHSAVQRDRRTKTSDSPRRHVLDPIDRVSEVLFGLIMVLTFTGSLSVAASGRDDVRAMLVGALGCNLAWGIIDAILYLMGCRAEKWNALVTFRAVRAAGSPADGRRQLAEALPPALAGVLDDDDLEKMRLRLDKVPEPTEPPRLSRDDWRGALGVFLLVVLSTFPVVIPFIVMSDALPALRVSNAIAIVLLAMTGYAFGRITGRRPVWVAVSMVVLGAVLVAMTMALGG